MAEADTKRLEGRVALITGGARGIGRAIADAFLGAGAKIIIADILDDDGKKTVDEFNQRYGQGSARYAHQDVTKEKDWQALCDSIKKKEGALDILVNNAGIYQAAPTEMMEVEDFRRLMDINVTGVFLGCKHAIPLIRQNAKKWKGGGSIVNLSSMAGIIGSPIHAAYCASKGAVRLMTKAVALEYAAGDERVRVNSIHPGVIDTNMGDQVKDTLVQMGAAQNPDEAAVAVAQIQPMGRLGEVKDIAQGALFLASDEAAFMTGAELVLDGGATAN